MASIFFIFVAPALYQSCIGCFERVGCWKARSETSSVFRPRQSNPWAVRGRRESIALRGHDKTVICLVAVFAMVEAFSFFFRRYADTERRLENPPANTRDDDDIRGGRSDANKLRHKLV